MTDLVDGLLAVVLSRGDGYSSYEVLSLVGQAKDEIERLRSRVALLEGEARIGADRLLIASGVCREWADRMRAMDGHERPPCPDHPTGREVDAAGKRVCSTCGR